MNLFQVGKFTSAAGTDLDWKVECDALTDKDWEWAAHQIALKIDFSEVEGVPTGGLALAEKLEFYAKPGYGLLIVDDVFTTGKSMEEHRKGRKANGAVLFSRTKFTPGWITPIWSLRM